MPIRPRLTPAMADVRRAVRDALAVVFPDARSRVHRDPSCGAPGGWVVPADAPVVLVGLSGGPDSLALAAALGFEQGKCGVRAGAVVVDHGLQDGSAEVAERAATQAREAGLSPVVVRRVNVGGKGRPSSRRSRIETSAGPEADARDARYAAFADIARETGAAAILLGHTLDDQAETVLLGLARGSGARSLAGMRAVAERNGVIYVRPFLSLTRELVHQSLVDQGIDAWQDPHNRDDRFTRVRVREHVLPVLERELGPGVAEALARTAAQLTADADLLDEMAAEALDRCLDQDGHLRPEALVALAPALQTRVVRKWALSCGAADAQSDHISAILDLASRPGSRRVEIPKLTIHRDGDVLTCSPAQ